MALGDLAGVVERGRWPQPNADHAAGDAAPTGWAVLKPEGLRAACEDAQPEAGDQCVPEDVLLLLRPESGTADHRLGEFFGFGHGHIHVRVPARSDSVSTAPDAIRNLRRDTVHYGEICL